MSPEGMGASISQINAAYSEKPGFLILSLAYSHRLLHTQNPIEVYHRMWSLIPRAIISFSMLIVMNFCGADLICNSLISSLAYSHRLLHTQNPIEVYHCMWSLIPRAILSFSMLIDSNFCGAELICNSLILSLALSHKDCYILRIQLRSTVECDPWFYKQHCLLACS